LFWEGCPQGLGVYLWECLTEKRDSSLQRTRLHCFTPLPPWLSCCCSQLLPLCYNATNS
ncbi:unnamed protein product, partial [Staurois parvus]